MVFDWNLKKEKLIKRFSSVKKSDLKYKLGREKEIIRKLRDRLGKSDEEILNIIIHL